MTMMDPAECCCSPCETTPIPWVDSGDGTPVGWDVIDGDPPSITDGILSIPAGTILAANYWFGAGVMRAVVAGTLRVFIGSETVTPTDPDVKVYGPFLQLGPTMQAGEINRVNGLIDYLESVHRTETTTDTTFAFLLNEDVLFLKSGDGNEVRLGGQSCSVLPLVRHTWSAPHTSPLQEFIAFDQIGFGGEPIRVFLVAVDAVSISEVVSESWQCYQAKTWGAGFEESDTFTELDITVSATLQSGYYVPKFWSTTFGTRSPGDRAIVVGTFGDLPTPVLLPGIPYDYAWPNLAFAEEEGFFYSCVYSGSGDRNDPANWDWVLIDESSNPGYGARPVTGGGVSLSAQGRFGTLILFDEFGGVILGKHELDAHTLGGSSTADSLTVSMETGPNGVAIQIGYAAWPGITGSVAPPGFGGSITLGSGDMSLLGGSLSGSSSHHDYVFAWSPT